MTPITAFSEHAFLFDRPPTEVSAAHVSHHKTSATWDRIFRMPVCRQPDLAEWPFSFQSQVSAAQARGDLFHPAEIHPAGQLKGNRLAAEQAEPARQLSHCKLFELADAHPPGQAKHSGIDFFGACHPPGHS